MKRFKNILVAADWQRDEKLLIDRSVALAKANGASLTIVEPFDSPPKAFLDESKHHRELLKFRSEAMLRRKERLERLAVTLIEEGVDAKVEILEGDPTFNLCETVRKRGHDLVMVSVVDAEENESILFRGLPTRLIRKCPCTVWAMKPTPPKGLNRIVAALNNREGTSGEGLLNQKILAIASSLADSEASELHVFLAWSLYGEAFLRGGIPEANLEEWRTREKLQNDEHLRKLVAPHESHIFQTHLKKGSHEIILPVFVRKIQSDLLVLGVSSRSGIHDLFSGSNAEALIQQVDCSVLAVHPD